MVNREIHDRRYDRAVRAAAFLAFRAGRAKYQRYDTRLARYTTLLSDLTSRLRAKGKLN